MTRVLVCPSADLLEIDFPNKILIFASSTLVFLYVFTFFLNLFQRSFVAYVVGSALVFTHRYLGEAEGIPQVRCRLPTGSNNRRQPRATGITSELEKNPTASLENSTSTSDPPSYSLAPPDSLVPVTLCTCRFYASMGSDRRRL